MNKTNKKKKLSYSDQNIELNNILNEINSIDTKYNVSDDLREQLEKTASVIKFEILKNDKYSKCEKCSLCQKQGNTFLCTGRMVPAPCELVYCNKKGA